MTRGWPNCAPAESAPIRSGLFPQLTGLGGSPMAMRYGSQPFEVIFEDITNGPRAESRAQRGVPDEWHAPALLGGGDAAPVVDAELVEPEPDRSDFAT